MTEKEDTKRLKKLVDEQAQDEGLWFYAETAAEAYLQQELRKLHYCIECMLEGQTMTEFHLDNYEEAE